jgi:hypothetical protein
MRSGPGFGGITELYEPVQFRLFEKGPKKPDQTGPEGTTPHSFSSATRSRFLRFCYPSVGLVAQTDVLIVEWWFRFVFLVRLIFTLVTNDFLQP